MVKKKQDQSGQKRIPRKPGLRSPGQMGGARPGAGRKHGSKNKITSELKDKLEPLEDLGLKRLKELLQDKATDKKILVGVIELVLAYRHGKPKQEVFNPEGGPPRVDWLTFLQLAHEYSQANLQQSKGAAGKESRAHQGSRPASRSS